MFQAVQDFLITLPSRQSSAFQGTFRHFFRFDAAEMTPKDPFIKNTKTDILSVKSHYRVCCNFCFPCNFQSMW